MYNALIKKSSRSKWPGALFVNEAALCCLTQFYYGIGHKYPARRRGLRQISDYLTDP